MDLPDRAVIPVVVGSSGVEGVAGGELRGGGGFVLFWGSGLRWFSSEFEVLGGSARPRGRGWWHWLDGCGSGCDERGRSVAAAEPTGDGEEGLPPSLAGRGGFGGVA